MSIVDVDTNDQLFYYDNSGFDKPKTNWRPGADFVRPKWGIYRSLVYSEDLRNEEVLFSYFSIDEVNSLNTNYVKNKNVTIYPNPTDATIYINSQYYNYAEVYDMNGKFILSSSNYEINISHFKDGFYIIKFFGNLDELICIQKVIKSNKK